MTDQNSDEDAFAREVFARLEPIEPSAALLRRVSQIPIEAPRESKRAWWAVWEGWPARFAVFGALALGVLVGAVPLEEFTVEASTDVSSTDVSSTDESAELEEALALAFGAERSNVEPFVEELR